MERLSLEAVGSALSIGDCFNKVAWFCRHDAYPYYDVVGYQYEDDPDVFQRELLRAMNASMRARSSVTAWRPLLNKPLPELAALPKEADLIDLSDEEYASLRPRLEACYSRIIRHRIGDVAATKMLYLKRPNLTAISDGFVKQALGIDCGTSYVEQALAASDAVRAVGRANLALITRLQQQMAAQQEPIRLSKVRIVDILVWSFMARDFTMYTSLFEAGCIKFGEFKLKSGIMSPVYVDFRGLISKPKLLAEIGQALAVRAKEIGCDRIAGIPYAGIPLGVAAALAGDMPMIYPRKEIKEHGTAKRIEGEYKEGDKVLVIDDIITDGASKIEAIEPLTEAGLIVTDVLVILDREQGGGKLLEKAGYQLHSLGTLSEVLDTLVAAGKVEPGMREKVAGFIKEHQFA